MDAPFLESNGAEIATASEDAEKLLKEFRPRTSELLARLQKAAGVGDGRPTSVGDLQILAAASMELLTSALANLPEPERGETVRGLFETLAIDVAQKRERLEQKVPSRKLDTPRGSA